MRAWQVLVDDKGGFGRFMGAFDTYVFNMQDPDDDCVAWKPELSKLLQDGDLLDVVLEAYTEAQRRIAELETENEYARNRFKEADLLFGKNLLVMQAAVIDWRATSDAKKGMAWIFNTLLGPGELPSEDEKDAQAYFDREYEPVDKELMELHRWFWERSERIKAERAAAGIAVKVGE
nr:ead/Ea22-like family protein [Escherichia coli]